MRFAGLHRLPIEQQPVKAQALGNFVELFEIDGLDDVAVNALVIALDRNGRLRV